VVGVADQPGGAELGGFAVGAESYERTHGAHVGNELPAVGKADAGGIVGEDNLVEWLAGGAGAGACGERAGEWMPCLEEGFHQRAKGFWETGSIIGDERGLDAVGGDFGGDDEAGDLHGLRPLVAGDAEEGGYGLGTADLEELADLGTFAEILVERAEDRAHGSCFGGLTGDLAVDDFAASWSVNGF
jgi:hypothetical protein